VGAALDHGRGRAQPRDEHPGDEQRSRAHRERQRRRGGEHDPADRGPDEVLPEPLHAHERAVGPLQVGVVHDARDQRLARVVVRGLAHAQQERDDVEQHHRPHVEQEGERERAEQHASRHRSPEHEQFGPAAVDESADGQSEQHPRDVRDGREPGDEHGVLGDRSSQQWQRDLPDTVTQVGEPRRRDGAAVDGDGSPRAASTAPAVRTPCSVCAPGS
jgi:hypothetical protein